MSDDTIWTAAAKRVARTRMGCCPALDAVGARLDEKRLFAAWFRPERACGCPRVWWWATPLARTIYLRDGGTEVERADRVQDEAQTARVIALLLMNYLEVK